MHRIIKQIINNICVSYREYSKKPIIHYIDCSYKKMQDFLRSNVYHDHWRAYTENKYNFFFFQELIKLVKISGHS